jgi:signal transduction histidine kinase
MGKKALPVVATLFALATVTIVSVTFGGPSFWSLFPSVPLTLFISLAITAFASDVGDWWPGAIFLATVCLFWLLHTTEVVSMKKTWPFLILIMGVLVVLGITINKKKNG